jgi:hypothetical protein
MSGSAVEAESPTSGDLTFTLATRSTPMTLLRTSREGASSR